MKRAKVVRLQGQPKKKAYKDGSVITRTEEPDASAMIASGKWGASKYWQLKLDECDKFSEVKVYDGEGNLVRTIPRPELLRPWSVKPGVGWNTMLFPTPK